ncbi:hypothetical protein JX580_05170 [Thiomicrospira microaerophila]|uniref:hypothetical protein n=1 Tax=Thiomicrospira microaerophila TaxID=406020 RepID=UPI0020100041|nr:hypothetical protein [Thiomicrospira microaerophila]UQB43268.1 hypothetical protein JX580_05170 [Thiomicrospira microaerophila]
MNNSVENCHTPRANWLIVSGGDQQELRGVFAARDLAKYFEGGIFGSPETKMRGALCCRL